MKGYSNKFSGPSPHKPNNPLFLDTLLLYCAVTQNTETQTKQTTHSKVGD
uniref:Uncharacterized protein n=2 Tax=Anguilla anguilla TaxID=7936 RepID=A0A0E9S413_ANGAN